MAPRPKSFDPEQKLEEALDVFWMNGYEGTSIPRLERELGINRFSLYATYGNKHDLFLKALDRYVERVLKTMVEPAYAGRGGLGDLLDLLGTLKQEFGDAASRGCFICNSMAEFGTSDPEVQARINAFVDRMEATALACLQRAETRNELRPSPLPLPDQARLIRTTLVGALIEVRRNSEPDLARRGFEALEHHCRSLAVEDWTR